MLQRYLPAAVAAVLICITAVWRHSMTQTTTTEEMNAMANRVASLPKNIGPWEGTDDETDQLEQELAGAVASINRTYRLRGGDEEVSLYLVCGARRDMSAHTPDRCYQAAGFTMGGNEVESYQVDTQAGGEEQSYAFRHSLFEKDEPTGTKRLEIFWSWSADGADWQAPENDPRAGLTRDGAFYKVYVISSYQPQFGFDGDTPANRSCYKFAQQLMPVLSELLDINAATADEPRQPESDAATAEVASAQ